MSSGQHLSKELYDLIKSIGETRSKQEEDKIIQLDVTSLKNKISEKNIAPKKMKEYLIRAIYIEMLGHDASFSYIHAVNLTQNKSLTLKRVGYLACSLLLDQNSDYLILLVANLQRDLASKSQPDILVALNAVAKLVSSSIIHPLIEPVNNLLQDANETIRKKAVMVLHKFYKISPGSISEIYDKMKRALCDKDPSVMAASLNLFYELIKQNPTKFKDLASSFVIILKQVIEHKLPRDYDYHRIPAPWIQIKLLQILALLGANDQKVSEQIYEVLGMAMRRADDTGINIGYAITYQCVKTISSIYPNQNLLETASTSVSRFLASEHQNSNNNLKYLGINALISIVSINPKYAIDHQLVVVDCLESKDETLKRETLDLLYKMTNGNNVDVIVGKLIHYLQLANDAHFRKELVNKITQISERFAPSQEWFINIMNTVLEYGSEFVDQSIVISMLKLIEENIDLNGESFGEFLVQTYLNCLQKTIIPDVMTKIIAWVFGEIGSKIYNDNPEKLEELVQVLCKVIENHHEDEYTKGWILSAISKLSLHPQLENLDIINDKFTKYSRSKYLELQQRAIEFKTLRKNVSQNVNFDRSFSFLNTLADRAIKEGAKIYQPRTNIKNLVATLAMSTPQPKESDLYFDASQRAAKGEKREGKTDEDRLKPSKNIWTAEGYQEQQIEKDTRSLPQALGPKQTNAISSKDFEGSKYAGIGSDKIGASSFPTAMPLTTMTTTQVQKKQEFQDDAEKRRKAELLFGLGPDTTKKPYNAYAYGTGASIITQKPTQTTSNVFQSTQPTQTNPNVVSSTQPSSSQAKKQTQEVNLLDLDFEPVKTTPVTSSTSNNTFDLLSNNGFNFLGNTSTTTIKPTTTTVTYNKYEPISLTLETYENYWTSINSEMDEVVVTNNVKTIQNFKKLLDLLRIKLISEIGNEMICAAKNKANEFILLYVVCNPNGKLEVKVKSTKKENMVKIIEDLKNASQSI